MKLLETRFSTDKGLINARRFLRYVLPRSEVLEAQSRLIDIIQKAKRSSNMSLKSLFPHFDKDGDRKIDRIEFRTGKKKIEKMKISYIYHCVIYILELLIIVKNYFKISKFENVVRLCSLY